MKPTESLKFPKKHRLSQAEDFKAVFRKPKSIKNGFCGLLFVKNNLDHPRFGFAVAKKNIPLAVDRNKVKRVVREQFRIWQAKLPNVDLIFVAKPKLKHLSTLALSSCLNDFLKNLAESSKQ